jgi:hypothetical protein
MLFELWPEWGAVRLLGRFIEQSIIADLCGAVPFGTIIFIPLLTTSRWGYSSRWSRCVCMYAVAWRSRPCRA